MSDKERIARDVGWLQGLSALLWNLASIPDETAATYDEVVNELHDLLLGEAGEDE